MARPRRPEVDEAINEAVRTVVQRAGYRELSYGQVASVAGVSRPSLYRRSASKALLVVHALVARYGLTPVPDAGSIEAELLALQRAQLQLYNDPVFQAALPGLLDDIRGDEQARKVWNEGFVRPRREGVLQAVARAIERGELDRDCDGEWVCEILTGPLISSAFLQGPRVLPATLAAETVSLVLRRFGTTSVHPVDG
ncbi:TetR-like C-terminal domain-containing protein [Enemella evansiae]|uniref:TetR-like C-terminal domain-containing protein n=1 Tax=Enemella evansiae TaxID=2016499 RepID=UPI0010EE8592|nr:TetR-like C-terminal domain-containing protein [Enemella evansiae]TDO93555.1 TetR family transcriptional regulator [Enemella evansiae]